MASVPEVGTIQPIKLKINKEVEVSRKSEFQMRMRRAFFA